MLESRMGLSVDKQRNWTEMTFFKITSSFSASFKHFTVPIQQLYLQLSFQKQPIGSIFAVSESGEAMLTWKSGTFFKQGLAGKKR